MTHIALSLETYDGLMLRGHEWAAELPRASVCLIHGLGEHSARYDVVAHTLNAENISVVAFDQRGHGQSDGPRGGTPDYMTLIKDIDLQLKTTQSRDPDLPLYLYGHSLGGNLVIHYVLQHHPDIAGVIATAPLLQLVHGPSVWKSATLRVLNMLHLPLSLRSGLDDTALSRDNNVIRTYRNDPLTHDRICPALASGMLSAGWWNLQHAKEFPCPILLMHGSADRLTSPEASRKFAASAPHCTLDVWEGLFHELHNEPERQQVLKRITDWLSARL